MKPTRTVVLVSLGLACAAAGAAQAAPAPATRLAAVLDAHVARAAPASGAPRVATVSPTRPITGARTVLPVIATRGDWLKVELPGRPNGHSAWIAATTTRRLQTSWRVLIDLSHRRLTVMELGRVVQTFRAVVGKPATPTPTGTFFVEEPVRLGHGAAGGPYALALSARSTVLREFDGGPGQIAIHGVDHLGGALGSAVSHGCVRLSAAAISWLVGRIGAGTPVTIQR